MMRKKGFVTALFIILSLAGSQISASNIQKQGHISRFNLDNGLVVLHKQVKSGLVAIEVIVNTGSAREGSFLGSGISHFIEHMIFKGTAKRGVGEISLQLKSYGGQMHGATSFDYTNYNVTVLKEYFPQAMELLADSLFNPLFDEEELRKERDVILKEFNLNEDNYSRKVVQLLFANLFSIHPYRHPIIGYKFLFKKLARQDLVDYHRKAYLPNNMIIAVVGDVKVQDCLKVVTEQFSGYERGSMECEALPAEPEQTFKRNVVETSAVKLAYLELGFHGPRLTNPDLEPMDVLANILGGGENSRLYRLLVEEERKAYEVNCWSYTPKEPGVFGISIILGEGFQDEVISLVLKELKKIKLEGVEPDELERVKKVIAFRHVMAGETVSQQARNIVQSQFLVAHPDFYPRYIERINKVKNGDVIKVAKTYLKEDNLTVAAILPSGVFLPEKKDGEPEKERKIEKLTLNNGLRILLREDHSRPVCSLNVCFNGGVRAENVANNGICNFTVRMLLRGTTLRKRSELLKELDELGGGLEVYSGNNSFGLKLNVLSSDLERGLNFASELILHPAFPLNELEKQRRLLLAGIKKGKDDPFKVCHQALRKKLFKVHPYQLYPEGSLDTVKHIRRQDILEFYRDYYVPGNMVISVFGDFKKDRVFKILKEYFGKLSHRAVKDLEAVREEERDSVIETKRFIMDKKQTVVMLGFLSGSLLDKDRYALDLLNSVISGHSSKLFKRIREELGLAYAVGAFEVKGPDMGYFVLYAATTGENARKVKEELLKQLPLLKTSYLTEEELAVCRNELIGVKRMGWEKLSRFSFEVALDELFGLGYDNYTCYEQKIESVTAKQLRKVANRYFYPNSYVVVTVGPAGE